MSNKRIQKKQGRFWCLGCGHNMTYIHIKKENYRSKIHCGKCLIDEMFGITTSPLDNEEMNKERER